MTATALPPDRRILTSTLRGIAGVVALLALAAVACHVALMRLPAHRQQIEAWIAARTGLEVQFRELDTRWRLYGPELVFDQAVIRAAGTADGNPADVLVSATRGAIALDLLGWTRTGRLATVRFSLEGPALELVRTVDGRLELRGREALLNRRHLDLSRLPAGRLVVSDAQLTFRDLQNGGEPLELGAVALNVVRTAQRVRLDGSGDLPPALGGRIAFTGTADGPLDDPGVLAWTVSLAGNDVALAGISRLASAASPAFASRWPASAEGRGRFEVSASLRGARLEALAGEVDLNRPSFVTPAWSLPLPGAAPLQHRAPEAVEAPRSAIPQLADSGEQIGYGRVHAEFTVRRVAAGWEAELHDLQLETPGAGLRRTSGRVAYEAGADGALALRGHLEALPLDDVWPWLAYLPERVATARLRALAARGVIDDLEFAYGRTASGATPTWQVSGRLLGVGIAPVERAPGFTHLSGEFEANDRQGTLRVASADLAVTLPSTFRDALTLSRVEASVAWTRGDRDWEIRSDDVRLANDDGRAEATVTMVVPDIVASGVGAGNRPPTWLRIDATAADVAVPSLPRYLPAGRLTEKTTAWFDRAFPGGRVPRATLHLDGPTRGFPYRDGSGQFTVDADIADVTLVYDPRWAPVEGIAGSVKFRNAGMSATTTARIHGLHVASSRVGVDDMRDARVAIEAEGSGDLGEALRYLQESPVGPRLGDRFMRLEAHGDTTFAARLLLPVRDANNRRIDVTATLAGAEVAARGLEPRLTDLTGPLRVVDRTLESPGITGIFLGGPVDIVLAAGEGPVPATVLNAAGTAQAEALSSLFRLPQAVALTGATDWRLQGRFEPDAPSASETGRGTDQAYFIDADLEALGIGLPAPLAKATGEPRALHAEIDFEGSDGLLVRSSLGDVRALARLRHVGDEWIFDRAGLRADGRAASLPDHSGMRIEGDIAEFVLDDWLRLGNRADARVEGPPLNDLLRAANVRVGSFGFLGYRWQDVRAVLQATEKGWQVDVAGPSATGQVIVPYDLATTNAPVVLDMEHLAIGERTGDGANEAGGRGPTDPRRLPSMQGRAGDLQLGERRLGAVRLQLERRPQGLAITQLTAEAATFNADATGTWFAYDTREAPGVSVVTSVAGTVSSSDVQATLRALGYGNMVAARRGLVQANLNWPGGPDAQSLTHASGTVRLEIEDGQVLSVEPGAGRMLGLFSVAALPRRLSLDFRDLTDQGLAFDTVRGDFEIKQGNAYTSNLLLSGPAAEIGIAGRTGLATRDYDQTAVVTGNIGVTLPVAGAVVGGPVVGAAMLLFSQVFKEPLKGITRGYYRITGHWDEPQVERLETNGEAQVRSEQIRPQP